MLVRPTIVSPLIAFCIASLESRATCSAHIKPFFLFWAKAAEKKIFCCGLVDRRGFHSATSTWSHGERACDL